MAEKKDDAKMDCSLRCDLEEFDTYISTHLFSNKNKNRETRLASPLQYEHIAWHGMA